MAGFVDADGSISIVTVAKNKRYIPKLTVCNCKKEVVYLFADHFGGKIRKRVWKNKNWRPNFEWTLTSKKASHVIKKLLPYLLIKKKQAELVLQAVEIKSKSSSALARWHPDKWQALQEQLRILKVECKELNKRGR
jgi:hypothetical protein